MNWSLFALGILWFTALLFVLEAVFDGDLEYAGKFIRLILAVLYAVVGYNLL